MVLGSEGDNSIRKTSFYMLRVTRRSMLGGLSPKRSRGWMERRGGRKAKTKGKKEGRKDRWMGG